MKKIISLVLALIMVLTMVAVSVSATGNTLTRNEAIQLAYEAYKFIFFAQESTGFENDYEYIIDRFYPIDIDYKNIVYFDESMDGKKYAGKHGYYLVKKVESPYEDLNTYEAIVEKANSIFSDYLVEKVLKIESVYDYTPGEYKKEYVDCFRKGENGELYTSFYIQPLESARHMYMTTFGALNVNGSNATIGVNLKALKAVGCESIDRVHAIFEFVKTDKGWRVCNGSAVSYMFREIGFPITNPNIPATGDNSDIMIPALAVLAVISVAIPVGMMKRRRGN